MTQIATCLNFAVTQTPDAPTRFHGTAYSGGLIPNYGWNGDAAIDLASITLPQGQIFALVDHNPAERAGRITASLQGNAIMIEGELFQSSNAGREVSALMAEGAPWQLSVGIQAQSDTSDKKRDVTINGQTLAVNTVFKNAVLREVSFVPVGADPHTAVAAFSRNLAGAVLAEVPRSKETTMTIEELQQQVSDLAASLGAEKTARQTAEAALSEIKLAARKAAIAQLAGSLSRELKAEEVNALETLDDPTFAVMSAALQSFKPAQNAPAHLFTEQATDGKAPDKQETELIKARAILNKQVTGKQA